MPPKALGFVNSAQPTIAALIDTFADAKTFGSLIQIPEDLNAQLPAMEAALQQAVQGGDLLAQAAALDLLPLVRQARILGMRFDAVVANPPYMGGKGMNAALKDHAKRTFPDSKSDLFAMFIERGFEWCKPSGFNSMVTMQSWMFLSSYQAMREKLLLKRTLSCLVHMGNGVMGIAFGTAATIFMNQHVDSYAGSFSYCDNEDLGLEGIPKNFPVQNERLRVAKADNFQKIPGASVSYWIREEVILAFSEGLPIGEATKKGLSCGGTEKYYRYFWEVSKDKLYAFGGDKWVPISKGGTFRKWFGNNEHVINWFNNGKEIKNEPGAVIRNESFYFKEGCSWNDVTNGIFSCRFVEQGSIPTDSGPVLYHRRERLYQFAAALNSNVANLFLDILCPTIHFGVGQISNVPIILPKKDVSGNVVRLIALSKDDWNSQETSPGFLEHKFFRTVKLNESIIESPVGYASRTITSGQCQPEKVRVAYPTLEASYRQWQTQNRTAIVEMQRLEEENNRLFIEAYGLQDELSPEVPEEQITLTRADREKDCQRLISYAIGCMMGRYRLDRPGLVYAHAGNVDFEMIYNGVGADLSAQGRINSPLPNPFPADADGIVPITDELWFEDDAATRIREFLLAVWGNPSPHIWTPRLLQDKFSKLMSSTEIKIAAIYSVSF